MRRCTTVAAITLCGVLAVSSAAPAFAAAHAPVVSTPGAARESMDRRPADDPKDDIKTELAEMKKELDQLVADAKKDATDDAADTKNEAATDAADAKKEAAELLKGIASLVKRAVQQAKSSSGA
ncbi:hypothetical protein [Streptomyces violascens]|uniref:Secreted protein n=1 Tax=Streptomyces violascens TaxID=67381 RepID=A0ABQ3QG03_9ACTN|nr:hypothetical protein [Streptomyces violascens]GGT88446.1 hypothetical protein GCM10010289_05570 [Streptomyces violascens]GHI36223.1 hypothetical protein Sviol_06310 [Streptomyces violascens]